MEYRPTGACTFNCTEGNLSYKDLSDEDKLAQAITFVAIDQPRPKPLEDFLREQGLYDVIVRPGGAYVPTD
jgi:hypothetical protein